MTEEGDAFKISLKPRCSVRDTIKELQARHDVPVVHVNIYKRFFESAGDKEPGDFFSVLGGLPGLKRLTIESKGSNVQVVSARLMASCIDRASELEYLHLNHIRIRGPDFELEELTDAFGQHERLKVLKLDCEDVDVLEHVVAAVGQIPTLEVCEIESATIASKMATPSEQLCWSKSLKQLKLINVSRCFGDLFDVISLLALNAVLEELTLQVAELDASGGQELVKMIACNRALKRVILRADRMEGPGGTVGEAFIKALDRNETLEYFHIVLDGRQSDMKVVRAMGVKFRDELKGKYKVTPQAGMAMGVLCERESEKPDEE